MYKSLQILFTFVTLKNPTVFSWVQVVDDNSSWLPGQNIEDWNKVVYVDNIAMLGNVLSVWKEGSNALGLMCGVWISSLRTPRLEETESVAYFEKKEAFML